MKQQKNPFRLPAALLLAFGIWTAGVCLLDVRAIGPMGSSVGLAFLNGPFHDWTGVHFSLYTLTDWLGLVPIGICGAFGLLGLSQWVRRKQLRKVDGDLLLLGGFYGVVMVCFLLFELFPVNYRPVLIEGRLEASYPSSTTLLAMCVLPTAWMQLRRRIRHRGLLRLAAGAIWGLTALLVVGRIFSGVHWISDIIGGGLLSAGLATLYGALVKTKA